MEEKEPVTDEDLLRAAFQALLRGDTAERDRLCDRIKARQSAREAESVKLAVEASPYSKKH
jgi:hypothetical protein